MNFYEYSQNYENPPSPKLINDSVMDELCNYFKLSNLLNMMRIDENIKPKHDITISNTIMDSIIDKKLGSITNQKRHIILMTILKFIIIKSCMKIQLSG
jgi:hypothetical protein